ncbi:MAG TPA: hypothetical protein VF098_09415 [Sphingomicrobium sp.]
MLSIPGIVHSVLAPDHSGARIFYRPHMSTDGGQSSPVFYDDGHGNVQQIATLRRNMQISWSPDGTRAFLQDNWGSNIADCYALTRTKSGITGVSLLKLIQRTPGHPLGAERPFVAHYYVVCDNWRSAEEIEGEVGGHTDENPLHEFSYRFAYDFGARRITWLHAKRAHASR